MDIRIALAGNPNSGKTTLFNALTGSNQFVGNWPGVTVEKKEGKLKKHSDVTVTDLPGIYSLSPYTMEEVVARNYLIEERPDAILNIIDGTNLERNLYLTTQLTELGIPVVIAINMMDIVRKNGDKINIDELSQALGCKVVEISALKGDGVMAAAEAAIDAAKNGKTEIALKGKIRTILLPSKLCRKLLKFAARQKTASGAIFRAKSGKSMSRYQIWSKMKKLCARAGVNAGEVFPHNLRHLFATAFYRAYKDIVKLADVLGHSSIETTRIYLVTSVAEHRRQLERLRLVS